MRMAQAVALGRKVRLGRKEKPLLDNTRLPNSSRDSRIRSSPINKEISIEGDRDHYFSNCWVSEKNQLNEDKVKGQSDRTMNAHARAIGHTSPFLVIHRCERRWV